jgi:F0F1-type ATP synthase epsilon subunit
MAEVSTAVPTMHIKVSSPFKIYFDDKANSITAANKTGPFDILPRHKNFMTLLIPCTLTVRAEGKPDFTLPITRAVMHVKADEVAVFLDV